jgi:hypothetical protein
MSRWKISLHSKWFHISAQFDETTSLCLVPRETSVCQQSQTAACNSDKSPSLCAEHRCRGITRVLPQVIVQTGRCSELSLRSLPQARMNSGVTGVAQKCDCDPLCRPQLTVRVLKRDSPVSWHNSGAQHRAFGTM